MFEIRKFFCLIIGLIWVQTIWAQAKNDYNWILGYPPNKPEIFYGGVTFDFNSDVTSPEYFNTICPALYTAVLSSNSGKLLAYSNGCSVYNSAQQFMDD